MAQDLLACIQGFVAVAEFGGFARAARALHRSTPVLTKQIKHLEQELKKTLLYRTTRYVELTEEGKVYLPYAQQVLNQLAAGMTAVHDTDPEPHGKITIAMPSSLICKVFGQAFHEFLNRYPKINLELIASASPLLVLEGKVDATISGNVLHDPQIISTKLLTGQGKIYAAPSYIKKFGMPKTVAELAQHNCLINTSFHEQNRWTFAGGKKVRVNSNFAAPGGTEIIAAGKQGIGLFETLDLIIEDEITRGEIVPVPLDLAPRDVTIMAYYRPIPHHSILRLFIEHLIAFSAGYRTK